MRHDPRARPGRRPAPVDVVGEPLDALDVEVVRRLVEEQHVPVAHQELRERRSVDAGLRRGRRRRPPTGCPTRAADDVADLRVARPLVLREVADHGRADRGSGREHVALVEVPDRQPAAVRDPAGVGLQTLREQREQRRLAVAVPADDADAVALVEAEGDAVEDDTGGELEMHVLGAEEMSHPTRVGGAGDEPNQACDVEPAAVAGSTSGTWFGAAGRAPSAWRRGSAPRGRLALAGCLLGPAQSRLGFPVLISRSSAASSCSVPVTRASPWAARACPRLAYWSSWRFGSRYRPWFRSFALQSWPTANHTMLPTTAGRCRSGSTRASADHGPGPRLG